MTQGQDSKKTEEKIKKSIYSVSDINLYVKSILRNDEKIQNIWVKGEISNFHHHKENHMYFILKDERSEINCAMFKADNKDLDFEPEEGMEVLCRGDIGLYTSKGRYQLIVKEMLPEGMGKLYIAYENLKEKLEEEGLFDEEHKISPPFLPKKIGVVTSEEGAALRDILRVLTERFPNIDVLISPAPVQGEDAAPKISEAIKKIDRDDIDVIILGRGGGSIEDLWNFNKEIVARTIFESNTPIISAVGHETDFLISDFVADVRAQTPTSAAEKAVPKKKELSKRIEDHRRRNIVALKNIIESFYERLKQITKSPVFKKPEILIEDKIQRLDDEKERLNKSITRMVDKNKQNIKNQEERLRALGPKQTMERGYSIVRDEEGNVVTDIKEVEKGEILMIKLKDGNIKVETKEVISSKKK